MFNDAYKGRGGAYIVDPETGQRRPHDGLRRNPAPAQNEAPVPQWDEASMNTNTGGDAQ
ncbi:hypothetical protein [Nitrosomonas halophila]|uniref:Uncharacterized protein n=1 Tax=Nitrosomonas halophila TaxID=44576 RepID=A0A1H3FAZ6_9PROT|nr:hypothetical protein [Nitrosomonas halophila]SDX88156.1 hypothetical protein SAMN05421881_101138 [Nitrosomonas halophila]